MLLAQTFPALLIALVSLVRRIIQVTSPTPLRGMSLLGFFIYKLMMPKYQLTDLFSTKERKPIPFQSSNTKFSFFFKNLEKKIVVHLYIQLACSRALVVLD